MVQLLPPLQQKCTVFLSKHSITSSILNSLIKPLKLCKAIVQITSIGSSRSPSSKSSSLGNEPSKTRSHGSDHFNSIQANEALLFQEIDFFRKNKQNTQQWFRSFELQQKKNLNSTNVQKWFSSYLHNCFFSFTNACDQNDCVA